VQEFFLVFDFNAFISSIVLLCKCKTHQSIPRFNFEVALALAGLSLKVSDFFCVVLVKLETK
jgi:hypothetical protein